MEENISEKFISRDFIYAVVGATADKSKYGYKVYSNLLAKGFKVVPVNPKYEKIDGQTCYPDLLSLEERPDVVVLIAREENAVKTAQECADLNLTSLWFEPGSEYEPAVKIAQDAGLEIMTGQSINEPAD